MHITLRSASALCCAYSTVRPTLDAGPRPAWEYQFSNAGPGLVYFLSKVQ